MVKIVQRFQTEGKLLLKECIQLSYFMRGAIPYESMLNRTYGERRLIEDFIQERLDVEMKKPNPVY